MSGYMWALHAFSGRLGIGNEAAADNFIMAPVGVPIICVGAEGFTAVNGASAHMV